MKCTDRAFKNFCKVRLVMSILTSWMFVAMLTILLLGVSLGGNIAVGIAVLVLGLVCCVFHQYFLVCIITGVADRREEMRKEKEIEAITK